MAALIDADRRDLTEAAKPSASRLRLLRNALADPALSVRDATMQIYGPGGSSKLGRDIYYVLRALQPEAELV